jgi:transposase
MEIISAVKRALSKYEDKSIRDKEIKEIKDYVFAHTGHGKFVSTSTVRKWIKEARKELKTSKKKTKKKIDKKKHKKAVEIAESPKTRIIKGAIYAKPAEEESTSEERKVVAAQNISYEMAAIRQLLQRINRQLDIIEGSLKQLEE